MIISLEVLNKYLDVIKLNGIGIFYLLLKQNFQEVSPTKRNCYRSLPSTEY